MAKDYRNVSNINNYLREQTGLEIGQRGIRNGMTEGEIHVVHLNPFTIPSNSPVPGMGGTMGSPHVMVGWKTDGQILLYDPQINGFWPANTPFVAFPTGLTF
jgi:hypothetical protein